MTLAKGSYDVWHFCRSSGAKKNIDHFLPGLWAPAEIFAAEGSS
jgi:hypothetical protein